MKQSQGELPGGGLLAEFEREIWSVVPHLEKADGGPRVVNPTPLVDMTDDVRACARQVYGLDLDGKEMTVLGKLESRILGGSVKTRPAVEIVRDAIAEGRLSREQTVFEATSGNFGIALGQLSKLGLNVVALVSRRLEEGVLEGLSEAGIKTIDLDMDICPAPGLQVDSNLLAAKAIALNVRSDLARLGFSPEKFDEFRGEAEGLLARQDVINLARLLAKIYGGFCPEQYDNELNAGVHEKVTGYEIEQQLSELGHPMEGVSLVSTFGTGGTSTGLSRYALSAHGRKAVHVVFPMPDQDVAGIRTKAKASGLKFYMPELYAGEHEVDFGQARKLLPFLVEKGYDVGESSALALYAVIQMVNFGAGGKYVVMLADGIAKYRGSLERLEPQREVTLDEARGKIDSYEAVLWAHTMFAPSEEGTALLAGSLGCDKGMVKVAGAGEVERLVSGQGLAAGLEELVRGRGGKVLVVCMAGGTSLRAAKALSQKGIDAQSLTGGISALSQTAGKPISSLVRPAGR